MLKLPPPAWAFLYLIIAGAVSWLYPWRALLDLRIVWLGVVLVAIGLAISVWAFSLFRSEGTEIDPTSETNKSLVVRGIAPSVRSSLARVRNRELGAYSVRGGENAPSVRRRVRPVYGPGSPVDLTLGFL